MKPAASLSAAVELRRRFPGIADNVKARDLAEPSLPPTPYEYADWKRCRVNLDYHIEIAKHFYSVPFRLLRQEVETRITAGRLARLMRSPERTRLLIIDEWGPEPLNAEQRRDPLEIVDDREGKGSLLITSQVPIDRWHEIIGIQPWETRSSIASFADRIELKGESLRKRRAFASVESLTNAREK
jgi:hypothetical protein